MAAVRPGRVLRLAVLRSDEPALALHRRHDFAALAEPGEPPADGAAANC
ncbi:hypothetical protein ACIRYZ_03480 [Kitasatospora sp. NPDC101155]